MARRTSRPLRGRAKSDRRSRCDHAGSTDGRAANHDVIMAMASGPSVVLRDLLVRRSANRSGGPIAAGKRPNFYVRNDAALQARIEMAHGPLIEVDDAAGPQRSHVIYPDDD